MDQPTQAIADYAAGVRFEALARGAVRAAKRHLIDSVGCALGAVGARPVAIARRIASTASSTFGASVLGLPERTTAEQAAFANEKRIIPLLHYALNPSGFLMLGASETINLFPELFSVEDKKCKIYRRKSTREMAKFDLIAPRAPLTKKKIPRGLVGKEEKAWSKMDLFQEA